MGLAHRIFGEASARFEAEWLPRFGEVLAASTSDAASVEVLAPGARVLIYPNAIPWTPVPPETEEQVIVFSGNLEYHPNLSAVRFFAREVWPAAAGPLAEPGVAAGGQESGIG